VQTIPTVRDSRDATVSDWRTTGPDHEIMTEFDIRECTALMLIEVATFESYLGKGNVRVLRYEDLMQSPEMMFNGFEVSAARASDIVSARSLDENRRVAERFKSASTRPPIFMAGTPTAGDAACGATRSTRRVQF